MKRFFHIIAIVSIAIFANACSEKEEVGVNAGTLEYYESSIFSTWEPEQITKELNFDFNEDALQVLKGQNLRFYVTEKVDGKDVEPANLSVVVYKDGEKLENNEFFVDVENDKTVALSFEIKPEAAEGNHRLYIEFDPTSNTSNYILDLEKTALSDGMIIEKKHVVNPGNTWATIIAIAIAALIAAWYLLIRPALFPHVNFSKIYITYPGEDDVNVSTSGYTSVILTNKDIKQGFLSRILLTSSCVIVNPVWTSTVKITCKRKGYLRVSGPVSCEPDEPRIKEEFTIITNENQRVKIDTIK